LATGFYFWWYSVYIFGRVAIQKNGGWIIIRHLPYSGSE